MLKSRSTDRDSATDKASASLWSRAPLWGKLLFVLAVLAGVVWSVRRITMSGSTAAHNLERAHQAASLHHLSSSELPSEHSAGGGAHTLRRKPRFNPAHGRRIFIDAGARDGDSLQYFTEHAHIGTDWDIYAFDPSPDYAAVWSSLQSSGVYSHLTYYPYAVWNKNETLTFAVVGDGQSTAVASAQVNSDAIAAGATSGLEAVTKVEGIDFDHWLLTHVREEDWVVLKMNIKGSESIQEICT